jgi:hypothetical protein
MSLWHYNRKHLTSDPSTGLWKSHYNRKHLTSDPSTGLWKSHYNRKHLTSDPSTGLRKSHYNSVFLTSDPSTGLRKSHYNSVFLTSDPSTDLWVKQNDNISVFNILGLFSLESPPVYQHAQSVSHPDPRGTFNYYFHTVVQFKPKSLPHYPHLRPLSMIHTSRQQHAPYRQPTQTDHYSPTMVTTWLSESV